MEHVIDSTTGMLADLDAKNGVANMRAEELLERYNKSGIDSLFNKFSDGRKAIAAPKVGEYVQFQEILKIPVKFRLSLMYTLTVEGPMRFDKLQLLLIM